MNNQAVGTIKPTIKFFEGERWLVITGLLGFLLAGICAIWMLLNGGTTVAPDGDVSKAFSFNAALGMFILSTAAVLPFTALRERSKAFFRWSYIVLTLFSYFAETLQNFRGVNPRFVKDGTPFDNVISAIFVLVALLLVVYYVFIAIQFFRKRTYKQRPALIMGLRYAMIGVMLSFAGGVWISANQGQLTGLHGNIIWFHGLGFHALQALPFVAWLAERKSNIPTARHRLIHITGIAYLLGLLMLGWQTLLGNSIFSWSLLPLLAICCFLIAFTPVVLLLRSRQTFLNQSHPYI